MTMAGDGRWRVTQVLFDVRQISVGWRTSGIGLTGRMVTQVRWVKVDVRQNQPASRATCHPQPSSLPATTGNLILHSTKKPKHFVTFFYSRIALLISILTHTPPPRPPLFCFDNSNPKMKLLILRVINAETQPIISIWKKNTKYPKQRLLSCIRKKVSWSSPDQIQVRMSQLVAKLTLGNKWRTESWKSTSFYSQL